MEEQVPHQSVTPDTVVQAAEQLQEAVEQQPVQAVPQPTAAEAEQVRNFKAMKEANDRNRKQLEEALQRIQELESSRLNVQQPVEQEPEEEIVIPDNDDIADNRTLNKLAKAYQKKIKKLEQQQESYFKQSHATTAESRFKAEYPDWNKVMSLDNIQTLSSAYPELAKSINSSTDVYDKAVSAYTLIKRFGIYDENPNETEKQRAIANVNKPRPLTSVSPQQGDTPLSRANAFANGLTEELKAQLRKEMEEARRGY